MIFKTLHNLPLQVPFHLHFLPSLPPRPISCPLVTLNELLCLPKYDTYFLRTSVTFFFPFSPKCNFSYLLLIDCLPHAIIQRQLKHLLYWKAFVAPPSQAPLFLLPTVLELICHTSCKTVHEGYAVSSLRLCFLGSGIVSYLFIFISFLSSP